MISLGGHGGNRGSNVWEINIMCTFSLIAIPKNVTCISTYDEKCKTVYGARNIFLYFNGGARKKVANHCSGGPLRGHSRGSLQGAPSMGLTPGDPTLADTLQSTSLEESRLQTPGETLVTPPGARFRGPSPVEPLQWTPIMGPSGEFPRAASPGSPLGEPLQRTSPAEPSRAP
jgi:hypothetical protein